MRGPSPIRGPSPRGVLKHLSSVEKKYKTSPGGTKRRKSSGRRVSFAANERSVREISPNGDKKSAPIDFM